MTALTVTLSGPLQSWGSASRFTRRTTEAAPTKSGVVGLLAAAQGCRRTDSIEHLLGLRFGVRVDQPGELTRDFQTARSLEGSISYPLTYRFYRSDAVFVAAVEGEQDLLEGLVEALRAPVFPIYLGRRSCPPAGPIRTRLHNGGVEAALAELPWQAARWYRRRCPDPMTLETVLDAAAQTPGAELVRDEPISFDPERREYSWRTVMRGDPITVTNVDASRSRIAQLAVHDPLAELEDD